MFPTPGSLDSPRGTRSSTIRIELSMTMLIFNLLLYFYHEKLKLLISQSDLNFLLFLRHHRQMRILSVFN